MARRHRKLPQLTAQDIQRFWNKVDKTENCWQWQGSIHVDGYAFFSIGRDNFYVHRIAYLIQYGVDPAEKLVCHICDNRACCRGDHFFLGTDEDNVQDCFTKKRRAPMPTDRPRGEKHHRAKLTANQVQEIRQANRDGITEHELARRYGVKRTTINHICSRRIWKHIA